jgi:hypothetical protein
MGLYAVPISLAETSSQGLLPVYHAPFKMILTIYERLLFSHNIRQLFSADMSGFRIIRSIATVIPTYSPKIRKSPPQSPLSDPI